MHPYFPINFNYCEDHNPLVPSNYRQEDLSINDYVNSATWIVKNQLEATKLDGIQQVWKISVSICFNLLYTQYRSELSIEELEKAKRFYRETDRQNFLTRRIMIRLLLGKQLGCSPRALKFVEGKNKKPKVAHPQCDIKFNISHSGDLIVIALSKTSIGIDIELINTKFQFKDIMDTIFTKKEQDFIFNDKKQALQIFYLLWTRKEAFLKYNGKGLNGDVKDVPSLTFSKAHTTPQIHSTLIGDEYILSLVSQSIFTKINYYEYCPINNINTPN